MLFEGTLQLHSLCSGIICTCIQHLRDVVVKGICLKVSHQPAADQLVSAYTPNARLPVGCSLAAAAFVDAGTPTALHHTRHEVLPACSNPETRLLHAVRYVGPITWPRWNACGSYLASLTPDAYLSFPEPRMMPWLTLDQG